jgi:hypothetical protein
VVLGGCSNAIGAKREQNVDMQEKEIAIAMWWEHMECAEKSGGAVFSGSSSRPSIRFKS